MIMGDGATGNMSMIVSCCCSFQIIMLSTRYEVAKDVCQLCPKKPQPTRQADHFVTESSSSLPDVLDPVYIPRLCSNATSEVLLAFFRTAHDIRRMLD